jgi:hypothetical protein
MSLGTDCPSCHKDIGVLSVFLAGTPNRIRCPHCKTRVRYVGIRRLLWLLALLGAFVFGVSFVLVTCVFMIENEDKRCVVCVGLVFALWALVELTVTRYLRRNKTLECVKGVKP